MDEGTQINIELPEAPGNESNLSLLAMRLTPIPPS